MYKINENVVFVKGAKNGAIYDFDTGKVYSVNDEACDIIKSYVRGEIKLESNEYLRLLKKNRLIDESFFTIKYSLKN